MRLLGLPPDLLEILPGLTGKPLKIEFVKDLSGRLGKPVHAGSNMRLRQILLDAELLENRDELTRILLHEVFHFAWVRLGNPRRRSFEELLKSEMEAGARGELGWSAETRKRQLVECDRRQRSRNWREYACESFCDTGAWKYGGLRSHDEWTLGERHRKRRAAWLARIIEGGEFRV
jgi:hypothetical protein